MGANMKSPDAGDQLLKLVGANVLRFRSDRAWTADDLAGRVSLDRTAIINIEAGKLNIDIDQLGELADALGIEAAELVTEHGTR